MADHPADDEWFAALCERIRAAVPVPGASLDRRAALAVHEAAHALVDHANGLCVSSVSLDDLEGRANASATGAAVEAVLDGGTPEAAARFIRGAVAGIVAEAMVTNAPLWPHAYADLVFARDFAEAACDSDGKVGALLVQCIEDAKRTLLARWRTVLAVAELLSERGEIAGAELEAMLG